MVYRYWFYNILYVGKVTTFLTLLLPRNGSVPETSLSRLTRNLARWHPSLTGPTRSAHIGAPLTQTGAKAPFSARRGLRNSMLRSIVQPDSMVTPCPDRSHTRRELFLIGLLEALPVCPMAPLVFIDFLSGPPGALRSASCRFRRGSARQMGSRPVYWTSSNLQGCILSRRRVLWAPFTSNSGCQSHFDGKPRRLPKAGEKASYTQTEDGSLLRVPQEVPAAHMTASLRPSGSHAIRSAGWHLELPVGGQGRPPPGGWSLYNLSYRDSRRALFPP